MTKEEIKTLTDGIQNKLGKESASLIADDLATLITDNAKMNNDISIRDTEIAELKTAKEKLQDVNMDLLTKVTIDNQNFNKNEEDEKPNKAFSFKSCFDEKGNFI